MTFKILTERLSHTNGDLFFLNAENFDKGFRSNIADGILQSCWLLFYVHCI